MVPAIQIPISILPPDVKKRVNLIQGFIKFKTVGEEYQVVKRGREYRACGEEYNVGKGKQYHLLYNIKAVGKNIKRGRGTEIMGKGNQG